MGHEKRRHLRRKADATFFVGCRSAEAADVPNLALKLIDVGALGACFVSRLKLKVGVRVQMLVVRPGAQTRASVDAVVRWVVPYSNDGVAGHQVGVEFSKPVLSLDFGMIALREQKPAPSADSQRRHRRFSPGDTDLVCVPKRGLMARILGLRKDVGHRLRDLSLSGAQIVSTRKLEPGQEVGIEIYLPDGRNVLNTEAVVRWCRRDTMSLKRRYLAGVQFGKLDDEAKHYLTSAQVAFAR